MHHVLLLLHILFFFNDPATTEIYTLSLHDALPISVTILAAETGTFWRPVNAGLMFVAADTPDKRDRKSTRLNSSHRCISYAVFCLKKKKQRRLNLDTVVHYAEYHRQYVCSVHRGAM